MKKNTNVDKAVISILRQFTRISKKHGELVTRRAANRWVNDQRAVAALRRRAAILKRDIRAVQRRLA